MKRTWFSLTFVFACSVIFAQNANDANKPLSAAQSATILLNKLYDFSAVQSPKALSIQEQKIKALNQIVPIKSTDWNLFFLKRQSIYSDAQSSLFQILDERQKLLFELDAQQRENRKLSALGDWRKQGLEETTVQKKLTDTDMF